MNATTGPGGRAASSVAGAALGLDGSLELPPQAVSNPNNVGNGNTYGGQVNLSGTLPGNTGYQLGFGVDQSNGIFGSDQGVPLFLRRR